MKAQMSETNLLTKENVKNIYALSPMQEGMLFHALLDRESAAYFQQTAYRVRGAMDVANVERALRELVNRHDVLRTVFKYKGVDVPLQIVLKEWRAEFVHEDLRAVADAAQREERVRRFKEKDKSRPFDLSQDALMRVAMLRLSDDEYEFVWSHHHILMDGWCLGVLKAEFLEIYASLCEQRPARLPEVRPYSTYIEWLESRDREAAQNFWRDYLAGYGEVAAFPTQKSNFGAGHIYRHERFTLALDKDKTGGLRRLASANQATLYQVVQAVWGVMLAKYTGARDVVWGTVVSGRPSDLVGVENIVGLFINTIPVRVRLEPEESFADALARVKTNALAAEEYDYFPLNEIQSLSEIRTGLFDHIMAFHNLPSLPQTGGAVGEAAAQVLNVESFEQTNYDLCIDITTGGGDALAFSFTFNASVHERVFIERTARILESVVGQILAQPHLPLKKITLWTQADEALLERFNATDREFPKDKSIVQLFENIAAAQPEATALVCNAKAVSYGQLNTRSNRLSRYIAARAELAADDRVAILMERSEVMVESILATWKAGAAYVPVDVSYPAERIVSIIADSGAKVVLTDSASVEAAVLDKLAEIAEVVTLNELGDEVAGLDGSDAGKPLAAGSLAYVIYTSGSTGKPKGAMIEHAGMLNHLFAKIHDLRLGTESVVVQNASHCFDISVWQFFAALLTGGRTVIYDRELVLNPEALLERVASDGVTILEVVPSYLSMLLGIVGEQGTAARMFPSLRYLLVTGEAVKPALLKRWFELFPSVPVVNAYGPTEASDDITHHAMTEAPAGETVPIGTALHNLKIYIADEHMNLCPIGVKGEVLVSGVGVGRGYLNDEAQTARAFTVDPFRREPGVRLYKTGDLGRFLENGCIEFFGRKDNQVKIRGFRIELEEIENILAMHPSVQECAVIDRKNERGDTYLSAYLVARDGFNMETLRAFLSEKLPDYMIPSAIVTMEKLPLTVNGKLDRKALRDLPPDVETVRAETEYVAPRNETEARLASLWQDVLKLERVGVRDNFFELGGDSFKAIRVASKFGKGFLVPDLYKHQTVEKLADFILTNNEEAASLLYEISDRATPKKIAVVGVPNSAGDPWSYKGMVESLAKLDGSYQFFGVALPRLEPAEGETFASVLSQLSKQLAAEIRKKIDVPLILFGQCNGTGLVIEVARLLQQENVEIRAVCMGGALPRTKISHDALEKDLRQDADIMNFVKSLDATVPEDPADRTIFLRNFRYDGVLAGVAYNNALDLMRSNTFEKFKAPLFCITGEHDPLTRNYRSKYRDWYQYAERVELVVVPRVGHYLLRDTPEALADIIHHIGEGNSDEIVSRAEGMVARLKSALSIS